MPDPARSGSEMETQSDLELPSLGRTLRLFGRAFTLRCPHCGGGPVLRHWLKMQDRCGRCGLRLERGERDYFIGSMMFNLVLGEFLVLIVVVAITLARRPAIPWDFLEVGVPLLAILFPVILFPFSKLVWLAFDIMFRPVSEAELEWHRTTHHDV